MKQQFLSDHGSAIKEQGWMLKEEALISDKATRSNHIDLSAYLDNIMQKIGRKMEILNDLKEKAEYLSNKVN